MPKSLKELIDETRGDIPRSRYILKLRQQIMFQVDEYNQVWANANSPKGVPMDEHIDITCYGIDCNNPATMKLELSLNTQLSCTIYVCDHCLPKFASDGRH